MVATEETYYPISLYSKSTLLGVVANTILLQCKFIKNVFVSFGLSKCTNVVCPISNRFMLFMKSDMLAWAYSTSSELVNSKFAYRGTVRNIPWYDLLFFS